MLLRAGASAFPTSPPSFSSWSSIPSWIHSAPRLASPRLQRTETLSDLKLILVPFRFFGSKAPQAPSFFFFRGNVAPGSSRRLFWEGYENIIARLTGGCWAAGCAQDTPEVRGLVTEVHKIIRYTRTHAEPSHVEEGDLGVRFEAPRKRGTDQVSGSSQGK